MVRRRSLCGVVGLGVIFGVLFYGSVSLAADPVDGRSQDRMAKALTEQSKTYLKDKQAGRFDLAYALIASSMRSYLTPAMFRDAADRFLADAGTPGDMRVTRLTWYRDPPDAPEPGLYAAVDFTAAYADLELMCGYLMWRQGADGKFRLVREEQNFIGRRQAQQMVPEQRRKLPELFGCVS